MQVILVSSEVYPLAKTGGLADVAGTLPTALRELGVDVRIVMPRHGSIDPDQELIADLPVEMGNSHATALLKVTAIGEVPVYLVDNYRYFGRKELYGYPDDAERYAFFDLAVLESLKVMDLRPDIIHCNDWQSGLIPALLKHRYNNDPFFRDIRTLHTIHNLAYSGSFPPETIRMSGLPGSLYTPEGLEFYGSFCFSKAGMVYSDAISTVSPTYAREIQTPEFGCRFEGILSARSRRLFGILNGIDGNVWNPATDSHLSANFSSGDLSRKTACKKDVQKIAGLPEDSDIPLIGMVTRLSSQKGLDILRDALEDIMNMNVQLVILGTGDTEYEKTLTEASQRFGNLSALIKYDEGLAHRIYAGCDLFLIPSRYEPCGLTQMIAFRYGTLPIVRSTGGLADTVNDLDRDPEGTGWVFDEYTPEALTDAVERALKGIAGNRGPSLAKRCMRLDHSWKASAREYLDLYKRIMGFKADGV